MKKKPITLVQTVATLNNCSEMAKKGILPLVITLNQEEAERIDTIKEILVRNQKPINEDLSSIEAISMLYYGHFNNKENGRYMYISSAELRELIETNKIYITKFIDYDTNIKYVDYIYPSVYVENTSGIVFRDKPRLFGKKKDHYKLIEQNVHISIGGLSGMLSLSPSVPYNANSHEFWNLYIESIKAYEKKIKY